MKFQVVFSTDGPAFQKNLALEIEHVLNEVQDQLLDFSPYADHGFGRLKDSEGNRVGYWSHQM